MTAFYNKTMYTRGMKILTIKYTLGTVVQDDALNVWETVK